MNTRPRSDETIAGRSNDPPILILTSLADGEKHGYALLQDIEEFAGVRLGPGTLYGAISRLEERGLIEAVGSSGRRRPYRLSAAGERLANFFGKQCGVRFVRRNRVEPLYCCVHPSPFSSSSAGRSSAGGKSTRTAAR